MRPHRRSHSACTRLAGLLVALAGPILFTACADARSDRAAPTSPEAGDRRPEAHPSASGPAPAPPEDVRRLHERFETITALHEEAIARRDSRVLGLADHLGDQLPSANEPEDWRAPMARLHAELEAVELAVSWEVTAASVARLAIVCGDCHRRTQASVLPPPTPPPTPKTDRDLLDAHRWGAQALWDAVVDASDERWARGTSTFEGSLPGCTASAMEASRVVAQQCHDADYVTRNGRNAKTLEGRAAVYGQLLSMCAGCHARAKGQDARSATGGS